MQLTAHMTDASLLQASLSRRQRQEGEKRRGVEYETIEEELLQKTVGNQRAIALLPERATAHYVVGQAPGYLHPHPLPIEPPGTGGYCAR